MFSIRMAVREEDQDALAAELWEAGTAGITEEPGELLAFFAAEDAAEVRRRFAGRWSEWRDETGRDWVEVARAAWQPFRVGDRFYLVPEWREDAAPCGRVRLRINPGLACGSGAHPATQICLRLLERLDLDQRAVLDVGTGSGILAQAAGLLGADPVLACDIDASAAAVARQKSASYPFPVGCFGGSLRSVRSGAVDVLVANLNQAAHRQLAAEYPRVLREGGAAVLSGFRASEAEDVARLFEAPVRDRIEQEEWAGIVL